MCNLCNILFDQSTGCSCWKSSKPCNYFISQFHSSKPPALIYVCYASFCIFLLDFHPIICLNVLSLIGTSHCGIHFLCILQFPSPLWPYKGEKVRSTGKVDNRNCLTRVSKYSCIMHLSLGVFYFFDTELYNV